GDIYVAGHLDTGTFRSDVFTSGAWTFNRKHATTVAVPNLVVAAGVLDGTYPSTSDATSFPSTVNFATPDVAGAYNYVTHVTGVLQANTSGIYSFVNRTDDGTWLYIDGQQVVYDTYTHPPTD